MLPRITVFLAALFVLTASGFAQQPLVISSMDRFPDRIPLVDPHANIQSDFMVYNPYKDMPSKLLVDTTLELFYVTSGEDIPLSDTSMSIIRGQDTLSVVLTFAPIAVNGTGGVKIYDVVGFSQFIDPFLGQYTVDSVAMFIFRAGLATGAPLTDDVYVFPVALPDGEALATYNFTFFDAEFNDEQPYYVISKDSLNSPARYPSGSIQVLTVPTPDLVIPANTKFGFIIMSANWFDKGSLTDRIGLISTHDWEVPINQTYGGIVRHDVGATEDSVQNIYTAGLSFGTGPRIKQNFVIRMFGTYTGEWPPIATDVRPEPNYAATGVTLGTNYPNPASQETHIRFSIERTAPVTLRLTDMLGQVVQKVTFEDRGPGSYVWDVNTSMLPTGTYFYTLTTGETTITRTMTVAR